MEYTTITYNGIEYNVCEIELDKISHFCEKDSKELVILATESLWWAIRFDYEDEVAEAIAIDDMIYFYCDTNFLNSKPTEKEVINYMFEIA